MCGPPQSNTTVSFDTSSRYGALLTNLIEQAHEADDEELSDLDSEDFDEDDSDVEVDIRSLVGKGPNNQGSGESPPAKKQRKS
jgi:hypothetical protein